jgi:glycosyltransferase involved in cell wall biosynthesis
MISFVVPAHNEERLLGATLDAIAAAVVGVDRPCEVLVVNDASTDGTRTVAAARGVRIVDVDYRHIAATRNAGARASAGQVLFFVDADTRVTQDAIVAALAALEDGAVGGGGLFRFHDAVPWWAHWVQPIGDAVARSFNTCGGAFVFCRRTAFDASGGFPEACFVAEDLGFVQALKRVGRFELIRPRVSTSGRKLGKVSFWQSLRWVVQLARYGPTSFSSREGLDLWYGEQARDP